MNNLPILEINKLTITMKNSEKKLLSNFSLSLKQDDKYAIIGEEGNGKSTLIKAIVDQNLISDYCDITGKIVVNGTFGYLEQHLDLMWNKITVSDFFLKNNPNSEIDYDRYNKLSNIKINLINLGLDPNLFESNQLIETLSGGEKVKIQLAKIMGSNPDFLLLDEPTNDLDLKTLTWLEEFINRLNIPIIFISHDETLLQNTAKGIIHLEQLKKKTECKHTIERIDYNSYLDKRFNNLKKQEMMAKKQRADHKKQMAKFRQIYQKVEHEQEVISRSDPAGARLLKKKIKTLKSQEKRFENDYDNFLEIPDPEEAINLMFEPETTIPNNKIILGLNLKELKIGNKILATNLKLNISGPQHVCIIGKNGIGKTTLFKEIYKNLKLRTDLKLGYMPQNYEDLLPLNESVINFVSLSTSKDDLTKARTLLGSMKFTNEEAIGLISELSGGQKAKLLLIKLILNKCNVLLLDEPTRNLSPLSNPVIRVILKNFKGTIISISHDRKYIGEVCDVVYELTQDGLIEINNL